MNEEEIIEIIEELMCLYKEQMNCDKYYNEIVERSTRNFKALQGLLDLYNKEKERNKELEMQNKEFLLRLKADGLIERDKYWTNKIKKALYDGILEAKGWGCEDGAYLVQKEFENLIKEIN